MTARTAFVTGGSRGIGRSIAIRLAEAGWNIALAAKTARPHRILPGTIHTVAEEVQQAGGRALAIRTDVRKETDLRRAIDATAETFGGIDALIHNAGAISLTDTQQTTQPRFDRIFDVNLRAAFTAVRHAHSQLCRGENPHILLLCPPLAIESRWLAPHAAYSISKFGLSMAALAWAEEFRRDGIRVNGLWPRTVIQTAALRAIRSPGSRGPALCARKPTIVADAAYEILSSSRSGLLLLDEQVLREAGKTDFDEYSVDPALGAPDLDLFVDESNG